MLYTPINMLDDDVLLSVFDYYRLDDKNSWNVRLGWCKLSHVCQRWRHLIYESAFHLGMHILCTNGTPIVDTLDHLPPLPLFVDYRYTNVTIRGQDELGIHHALRLRDRVRRIDLHLPPSILHKFLMLMDEHFQILAHLSLSFTVDKITALTLPKTFLAPNLRRLVLLGIDLPKRLRLLCSTISLVTLVLTNIGASGYFRPRLLVARLQSLLQLEELSVSFSIPIPRPSAERELLGNQGPPVTLRLKFLTFKGVSAYLERLFAQIRAPLLERLDITLFNQIAFALPHLSHFINTTKGLNLPTAKVFFGRDEVSITTISHSMPWDYGRFDLRVMCNQLDWQIDCAAQVCSALMPALSGVQMLTLVYYADMPTEWQDGEIDGTTWHELLRSFFGVQELRICNSLSEELSRALEVDEIGSDPGLLPGLRELVSEYSLRGVHRASLFASFINSRWVAGRPVRSSFPLYSSPDSPSSVPDLTFLPPSRPQSETPPLLRGTTPNIITLPDSQLPPGFVPRSVSSPSRSLPSRVTPVSAHAAQASGVVASPKLPTQTDPRSLYGVPVPDASSSSDRPSLYHPVRTPLTSTTADSPIRVPPPSIFSRSPESSSSEEEDDEVASSITSSDDSLTTPPPPRRRPRPRPNTYDAAPIPPGLEYPAAPLMRGDA